MGSRHPARGYDLYRPACDNGVLAECDLCSLGYVLATQYRGCRRSAAASLSVSGATFLILELDTPLTGWIHVSPVPIQRAIAHLGL